tara:strand:+ start:459 stop:692 length:234 start_codon:yes stop_codon:yes gene_type:complete
MNLNDIKKLLSNGDVLAEKINPIINTLSMDDLEKLSELEANTLREVLNNMLVLLQDPSSGAYIENLDKANALLVELA